MVAENNVTTKLLTLLNVTAVKGSKRKRYEADPTAERVKLNKKKKVVLPETNGLPQEESNKELEFSVKQTELDGEDEPESIPEDETHGSKIPSTSGGFYSSHFSNESRLITSSALSSLLQEENARILWHKTSRNVPKLGRLTHFSLSKETENTHVQPNAWNPEISKNLAGHFEKRLKSRPDSIRRHEEALLSELVTYQDIHYSHLKASDTALQSGLRDSICLHLVNHVMKIRQQVMRNNDRLSAYKNADPPGSIPEPPPESLQDQGFTRPSTLILLPFRNSAVRWMESYLAHFPSKSNKDSQIHNYARFLAEFSLPPGAVDKLVDGPEAAIYPTDHIETFKGNIDDNFRFGVKITKKAVRLFEKFYGSDLIIASPLGLRLAIEKEKNADFLSSIEIVVMDQTDAMTMQNWEHVKFIFSKLNHQPKESHDTDFSRVKSWYLDGHASYLRQNIVLSAYETPQIRAFFTNDLRNVAGKTRFEHVWEGTQVPEGVKQKYIKFTSTNGLSDPDRRFEYFTQELFPAITRSAVQSSNTLIFIPSYFDFVRVKNWLRKKEDISATWLSEDSTQQDISRARQAFVTGKKSFLILTERFYFFRRYRIRGILNLVFYGPPDHAQFYSELLTFPFIDEGVDPSDVSCQLLYSKYDAMALERIVGSRTVGSLIDNA